MIAIPTIWLIFGLTGLVLTVSWVLYARETRRLRHATNKVEKHDERVSFLRDAVSALAAERALQQRNNKSDDIEPSSPEDILALEERLLRAAAGRDTNAMCELARIHEQGIYGNPDAVIGMGWYLAAAERGNRDAMLRVGQNYARGFGVEQNMEVAEVWIAKAMGGTPPPKAGDAMQIDQINKVAKRPDGTLQYLPGHELASPLPDLDPHAFILQIEAKGLGPGIERMVSELSRKLRMGSVDADLRAGGVRKHVVTKPASDELQQSLTEQQKRKKVGDA